LKMQLKNSSQTYTEKRIISRILDYVRAICP